MPYREAKGDSVDQVSLCPAPGVRIAPENPYREKIAYRKSREKLGAKLRSAELEITALSEAKAKALNEYLCLMGGRGGVLPISFSTTTTTTIPPSLPWKGGRAGGEPLKGCAPAAAPEAKTRDVYLRKAQARRLDFALRASLFETKTWNDKNRADSPTSSGLQPQRSEKQALATTLPASRYVYLERAMVKRQEHRRCRSTQKTELPHP